MSETADASERDAPRAGWLDRWCAVRWRAWLTWVVLAGVMGAIHGAGHDALYGMLSVLRSSPRFAQIANVVPPFWQHCAIFVLTMAWFPPWILRLGLRRSVLWVLLGIASMITLLHHLGFDGFWQRFLVLFATASVPGCALIGRRSRPWLATVGGACWGIIMAAGSDSAEDGWLWLFSAVASAPYAFILLYGTELIEKRRPVAAESPRDDDA
jgi:hypothetical protein